MIRKATIEDIDSIVSIYDATLNDELKGLTTTGWLPGIYPVRDTAISAIDRDDLYVLEEDGCIKASAIFNKIQVDVYANGDWQYPASDDKVFVIHTLVVDPQCSDRGYGHQMIEFYEKLGKDCGASVLRLDTNMKNKRAFSFYISLGYSFIGFQPCIFNGIPNVNLALFEKKI